MTPAILASSVSLRLGGAPIDQTTESDGLASKNQILQKRQRRRQHELLMDHADSARIGVGWTGEPHRMVVEYDAAFVRMVDALQDAHQRRLAGAVAPDDDVDGRRRDG